MVRVAISWLVSCNVISGIIKCELKSNIPIVTALAVVTRTVFWCLDSPTQTHLVWHLIFIWSDDQTGAPAALGMT